MSSSEQFVHLEIPLKEIATATNNFSDANIIGEEGFGRNYKGQLMWDGQRMDIVARRSIYKDENKEFWREVSILSKLNHKNLASIVGFCDENGEKVVINKHETHGSLRDYIRDPTTLKWMQRLRICVGVAHALSYIHYDPGRDFSVIHRDIKSSRILLDDLWEPKLSGFEYSVTQLYLSHEPCGTYGYCDPTYKKNGTVTHKSDIYSFGVVLFEVLCGREANGRNLAPSARSHYEKGRLEDLIDPSLWKQMDPHSFKIFWETAYFCLNQQRSQRPSVYQVVRKLEEALESQRKHENPTPSKVEATTSKSLKEKDLKYLEIPLIDIELATENFSKTYLIGSGTYGEVYKAELEHFDNKNLLSIKEKNKAELPKKRSIVAIKRIKIREDKQGEEGFLAEIDMLTSCDHCNIVSLLGFCEEGGHMILVYEYASNGSLSGYLGSAGSLINLTWVQRINICIGIARGLDYLHTKIDGERRIIHRDVKSDNILLGENWEAKIADFGLSTFRTEDQQMNKTVYTQHVAGTEYYLDPEYVAGKLKNESDIYSFGVVLFEMMSGKFAYDPVFTNENSKGIAHVARRRFQEGTNSIKEMVDSRLMEEIRENIITLNKGPNQDSLDAFSKIAYQCVAESQAKRPPAQVVIKKLEEALSFQVNTKDHLKISLEDISEATDRFSDKNKIGRAGFGRVYKGEVTKANGCVTTIAAKRMYRGDNEGETAFFRELEILLEYKHENIIGFVGYCKEAGEGIIVSEYASRGSLDFHLHDDGLTWMKRLEISIDIASGLNFLHGEVVMHRDIKSSNILLTVDWKAKITDFGISLVSPLNKDMDFVIDNVRGTHSYCDPVYIISGFLTQESDIYSFGVVLFEILCARLAFEGRLFGMRRHLPDLVEHKNKEGKLDEIVFKGIKEQIAPKSLTTFQSIALRCIHREREQRPTICQVLQELKKALQFQEDYEIWEPNLPKDYNQIFQMSNSRNTYSTQREKDLFHTLCNGILLQQGKLLFTLDDNGGRKEMISAKTFSYINHCPHKWRSIPESRFTIVAKMLDILNLKIKIKTKTQLLSSDVVYGVYLVFKFCDPRKVSSKPLYVNLKFKNGSKTSHAYFATWRDDEWLMIELCRFLNNKTNIVFKFLLESFSRYYCGDSNVYVEGLEFRPIDDVEHEKLKESKEVQQVSDSKMDMLQTNREEIFKRYGNDDLGEKLFLLRKVNGKKHVMLSAKAALYNISNMKLFKTEVSAALNRFSEVIELLPQQVFRINCTIKSQMLSQDTDYICYLVFNLSEKCCGLHCPVKVRDLLHRNNKEVQNIYFRSPSPRNLHDKFRAPEQREDGWMEVQVWKFNFNHELKNDRIRVNLKLISYEGTMSGLILSGLEFRPVFILHS